jgi:hypothetical protein
VPAEVVHVTELLGAYEANATNGWMVPTGTVALVGDIVTTIGGGGRVLLLPPPQPKEATEANRMIQRSSRIPTIGV